MAGAARTAWLLVVLCSCCSWTQRQILVAATTDANDVTALNTLFTSMNSPGQLQGWKVNGGDPCGESWQGITCSGSSVIAIKLPSLGLSGTLSYNMNNMESLVELDMSQNNLGNGQQIPYNLPNKKLERLNLAGNQFTGTVPYSISTMSKLKYLNINHNQLSGDITDIFSNLPSLTTVDLSFNSLTGPAPPPPPFTAPPHSRKRGKSPGQHSNGSDTSSSDGSSGIGAGAIAGIVVSILVVGAIVAFFLIKRKQRKSAMLEHFEQRQPFNSFPSNEVKDMKPVEEATTIEVEPLPAPTIVNVKPPLKIERKQSFDDDGFANKPVAKKVNAAPVNTKVYSVADLQMATDSFNMDNLVGEGTFGRVYRAQFNDGKVLAVKKLNNTALPSQSSDDFSELVSNISKLHHPNLSELVGYCMEHGQHLLVYDFHKNGSLHDMLHLSDEYNKPLSWNSRVKIALGSARALEYLHEICSPSLIHKNFKSSNILLDMELNPHISDAGLASFVPDAEFQVSDQGSGYSAPEVDMTGQYTLKSDVYSFGVVMLELLTGRKPFDSSKPRSEQSLVRWATPQLHDIDALDRMVDPALKGLYPAKSLSRFADVVALCVQPEPEFRPPMSEVVQALVRLVQRANMTRRMLDGEEASRRPDDQDQEFL
ncbi:hypothetical protein PR202_ga00104 [Eleusine coracana subsp. coracana]|uniref:non-specific serine/threonine protein kinase n=1 Tax=Eleusine coracana subsp. coracana TaxID=191504 RepID=A0AAV5BB10_ELECO|nr:hypothetical protein PR202_ga00104 [Eleusine coracana subsp. coracana]